MKGRLTPGLSPDWLIVMGSGTESGKINHLTPTSRKVNI